jgi:predicted aconitase
MKPMLKADGLSLSVADERMLAGDEGPAPALALAIICRMAVVLGAERLLPIESAHLDSSLYLGPATLAFAERLAGMGAKVSVPTTLNVSGVDEAGWQAWPVPAEWAAGARRQMQAYQQMGAKPTWTCAPYQAGPRPAFGQQIAWGESSAIVFANSVLGARTARYPDFLDICAAITGRVPAAGLHLEANRRGQILVDASAVSSRLQALDGFYPVFGHWLGQQIGDRVAVIDGLAGQPEEDDFKAFGAAAASSGSVGLFHWVGVTPEAPTRQAAFAGAKPERTLEVSDQDLAGAYHQLTTSADDRLDMVVLGSPHFSLAEFQRLAPLLAGQQKHPSVRFLITTSRAVAALAERAGLLQAVRGFGADLTVDTCILTTPMLPPEIRRLMTNSAKYAYYAPGLLNTQVVFGGMEDCVRSAVAGRVERRAAAWAG